MKLLRNGIGVFPIHVRKYVNRVFSLHHTSKNRYKNRVLTQKVSSGPDRKGFGSHIDLKMKISAVLLLFGAFVLQANPSYAQKKISLNLENVTVERLLDEIESRTDFRFIYSTEDVDIDRRVSVVVKRQEVSTILNDVFVGTRTSFSVDDGQIFLLPNKNPVPVPQVVQQDPITVTGQVTNADGVPLPGVSVIVKGTSRGVATDFDGNYQIVVPNGQSVLVFTSIGYAEREINIGNQTNLNVTLEESVSQLDDVVVVGYGEQSRVELTGTVAKIKQDDIENLPVVNVNQALQGQASGVFVTNPTGAPGGAAEILIRGQSSITAGNSPLFIIDGAPVSQGVIGNNEILVEGPPATDILSSLNPNDIESIEVLKDASAKAIYGARASNGVVLITTKKGKTGKARINFSTLTGVIVPTNNHKTLNTEQYLELQRESYTNDDQPIPDFILNADSSIDNDWIDLIFRNTTFLHEHNLSVSGGAKDFNYFISANHRDEQGLIRNNKLTRTTLRSNMEFKASKKLDLGLNVLFGRTNNKGASSSEIREALKQQPTNPLRNELGQPVSNDPSLINPLAILEESISESTTDKLILSGFFKYLVLPGLQFRTNFSADFNYNNENRFDTENSNEIIGFFGDDVRTNYNRKINTLNIEPFLIYNKNLNQHNFELTLGATFLEQNDAISFVSGTNFPSDQLTQISNAGQILQELFRIPYTSGTETAYSFNSTFLRLNYNFSQKYLLNATIRRDGSSRFGPDTRYGVFWAVSGGWNFYKESFFNEGGLLSFGKLRASIGVTGNDQIGNFPYIGTWGSGNNYLGQTVISSSQVENSDLKWEETRDIDVGLDLGFFKNRFEIGLTYFNSQTSDLLFNEPLPFSAGFSTITENIGTVRNQGWELNFSGSVINNEKFTWRTNLNITKVKNEVISLLGEEPTIITAGGLSTLVEGEPINTFFGLDFLGIDAQTGDALYRDINNDGEITLEEDRTVIGNAQPDFYGGLTNTFNYKDFSLDVLFQFVLGPEIFNASRRLSYSNFERGNNATSSRLDRWQQPGDVTNVPRLSTPGTRGLNYEVSSQFLENGSYGRLKNLTLSYNFPANVSERLGISNARIFLSGQNLFTITDYSGLDPEVALNGIESFGAFPQTQIYSIGLNINF